MKIALIHSHLNDRGGSQRYVIEIANNLQKLGMEVDVFCYEYNKKSCYPELTKNINISKIYTREEEFNNSTVKLKNTSNLQKIIKSIYKINIAKSIVNSLGVDYLYSLYITRKLAKKVSSLIQSNSKKYDLIFAHEEPLSVYAAIDYKKKYNIPIYWFCYDSIEKWFLEWKEEHKNSLLRKILLKSIYFKYDKFIINKYVDVSAVLDNNMLKRYEQLYKSTPLIRRGGIPEEILEYSKKNMIREKYNLCNETLIIFSLSRFINYRRIHDIFEMYMAFPENLKSKVFIYLNSPITDIKYYEWCMEKYKDIVANQNIVINLEYPKNDNEMYDRYRSSDIFIFPNENQTWGHAPLEAMGCGVATLVSNGCGINEVIKKVTSETVYNVGDTKKLAKTIEIIEKNKEYITLSLKQKKYVEENLTWKKICEIYIKDFHEILRNKNNV